MANEKFSSLQVDGTILCCESDRVPPIAPCDVMATREGQVALEERHVPTGCCDDNGGTERSGKKVDGESFSSTAGGASCLLLDKWSRAFKKFAETSSEERLGKEEDEQPNTFSVAVGPGCRATLEKADGRYGKEQERQVQLCGGNSEKKRSRKIPFSGVAQCLQGDGKFGKKKRQKTKTGNAARFRVLEKINLGSNIGNNAGGAGGTAIRAKDARELPVLDENCLYTGKLPMVFVVERPNVGIEYADLNKCNMSFLPDGDVKCVGKVYMVYAANLSFTTCMDLHKAMHGFVTQAEAEKLDHTCFLKHIPSVRVPPAANYNQEDNFLRVINGQSPEFHSFFPPSTLRFNVLEMVRALVKFGGKRNKVGARNNLRFDGGFTDHAPDIDRSQGTLMGSRKLQNVKEPYFYTAAGKLLEAIDAAIVKLGGKDECRPFPDPLRRVFSKHLAKQCGLSASSPLCTEAFSWCLSKIGPVPLAGEDLDGSSFEHVARRHCDRKNDHRGGYNISGSLSFVVVYESFVYRLSLVAYTRKILGNIIAREFGVAQGIYESCQKYHQEVGEYREFLPSCLPLEVLSVEQPWKGGQTIEIKAVVQRAFGNKCGYFSVFVCAIRRLAVMYDLQRGQVVELLYCALMCNGPCKFWIVCRNWLTDSKDSPFSRSSCGKRRITNLVVEFYRECRTCGFGPQGGPKPRHSSAAGCWPGISAAEFVFQHKGWSPTNGEEVREAQHQVDCLDEQLRRLDRFLTMADCCENMKTRDLLEMMCAKPRRGGGTSGPCYKPSCFSFGCHGRASNFS